MKRVLAGVFVLAAVAMLASPVWAVHLTSKQLMFRTHKATAGTGETLVSDYARTTGCVACMVDSIEYNRLGATGATLAVAQACTTTAFSTAGLAMPPASGVGSTSTDSSVVARVIFTDGGAHGAGDSLLVAPQVSADGVHWSYVGMIAGQAGANPLTSNVPTDVSMVTLLAGGDISFTVGFVKTITGSRLPDRYNFWTYPLVRFVVLNEHAATVHNLTCKVVHWED